MKMPDQIKRQRCEVRLTPVEKVIFREAARRSSLTFASWTRERLREAAERDLEADVFREDLTDDLR